MFVKCERVCFYKMYGMVFLIIITYFATNFCSLSLSLFLFHLKKRIQQICKLKGKTRRHSNRSLYRPPRLQPYKFGIWLTALITILPLFVANVALRCWSDKDLSIDANAKRQFERIGCVRDTNGTNVQDE